VRNELLNGSAAPAEERPKSAEPSAEVHKLIQSYEDRIREQADMIQFLQEQVGKRDEQILALMPGPQERANGEPSKTSLVQDGRKLSRWQALRFVLLGR
jgi:regulator of protease activity HflC (stomatin/prohibitin superfamily)